MTKHPPPPSPPGTETKKRQRVTPHPYETRVAQYLQRFREHGGGAQKEPNMAIMQALRDGLREHQHGFESRAKGM